MKILVTGSRTWWDREAIFDSLAGVDPEAIIIHGASKKWDKERQEYISADYLAGLAAAALGLRVREYPADWERYRLRAGFIRNEEMLVKENPDIIFAYRMPGTSNGTDHMMRLAMAAGKKVLVHYYGQQGVRKALVSHWMHVQEIIDSE